MAKNVKRFKHKKVLVTGATGFIGSHLVQKLIHEGASVRAITHYRSSPDIHNLVYLSKDEIKQIEFVKGDVQDAHFTKRVVQECDYVFHLAALIAIPYSYVAPSRYVATNVVGTLNILEACRDSNITRLVHISTSECYGTALYTPIDEDHPLQGQSPYSASKIGADKLAESYYRSFDLPVVTIRPFNTYGPRQSDRAVIPTIIGQLLSDSGQLKLGSLDPIRDFTFATDTAEGMICGALAPNAEGELFNLGTGSAVTIGELAYSLMGICNKEVPIITEQIRQRPEKSEVMALLSANKKAEKHINWTPSVSLGDGLRKTVEFFQQNSNILRAGTYGV